MDLAQEAGRLYETNNNDALFRLAETHWPQGAGEFLPSGIAEVCRLACLRAIQKGGPDSHVWRARAMAASVLTGARDTAAGLLLYPFFCATAEAMNGGENGHVRARSILEEIRRLVPEGTEPWSRLYARLYHEKRAYSFLMEATDGERPHAGSGPLLDAAEAELIEALQYIHDDSRGDCKVRGGLALVRYLKLADAPAEVFAHDKDRLLEETRAVLEEAEDASYKEIAGWAATNAETMLRGAFSGWIAYEIA